MKIKPLADRVLIEQSEAETKTERPCTGLHLTATQRQSIG